MLRPTLVALPLLLHVFVPNLEAQGGPRCAADNAGLTLPSGFCALIVADSVGRARHLTVAPNGDVVVAISGTRDQPGGVVVLRDRDGDGRADITERFAGGTGDDVAFHGGFLYFATNGAVVRFPWRAGEMRPAGEPDTLVSDLPAVASHRAKSIAFGADGALYVNIGSPTNACQDPDRTKGTPGQSPCEALRTRAGIWRFAADRAGQKQADGRRYATGLRNTVALAFRPQDGKLYGAVHGRDQLADLWPEHFTAEQSAEKPAEEFVRLEDGADFGWPYCFFDPQTKQLVLAPEYGGDGETVGLCKDKRMPLIGFPGHWAPDGLHFYQGAQFPATYRGGAFIAFHGSWNRAPLPQQGYRVVFVPFRGDDPVGDWEVFADGFAGGQMDPRSAAHRPVGLAEGPDGSLYISDDSGGRIYRVIATGR